MKFTAIKELTIEQAIELYKKNNLAFILKDGQVKGFTKDNK